MQNDYRKILVSILVEDSKKESIFKKKIENAFKKSIDLKAIEDKTPDWIIPLYFPIKENYENIITFVDFINDTIVKLAISEKVTLKRLLVTEQLYSKFSFHAK